MTGLRLFFSDDPPPSAQRWLVPGIIPAVGLTTLAGPPGGGKSLLALSLAVATASGKGSWLGVDDVMDGTALYLAGEAVASTRRRLAGMATRRHQVVIADAAALNLTSHEAVEAIAGAVDAAEQRIGSPIRLIVADALGSLTRGADENSARDMSRAAGALLRIASDHDAAVVLIAHTSKAGDDPRVRGHSGLLADVDAHLAIRGADKPVRTLTVYKQRDGEVGHALSFRVIADDAGALDVVPASAAEKPRQHSDRLPGDAAAMLRAIAEFGRPIPFDTVRQVCAERFAIKADGTKRNASAVRQAVSNARRVLLERGIIVADGPNVSVSKASASVSFSSAAYGSEASAKTSAQAPLKGGPLTLADTLTRPRKGELLS